MVHVGCVCSEVLPEPPAAGVIPVTLTEPEEDAGHLAADSESWAGCARAKIDKPFWGDAEDMYLVPVMGPFEDATATLLPASTQMEMTERVEVNLRLLVVKPVQKKKTDLTVGEEKEASEAEDEAPPPKEAEDEAPPPKKAKADKGPDLKKKYPISGFVGVQATNLATGEEVRKVLNELPQWFSEKSVVAAVIPLGQGPVKVSVHNCTDKAMTIALHQSTTQ